MGLTRIRAQQISDIDYKQSVRVITLTDINLTGGAPAVVDGVGLGFGSRILVNGQTAATQNGLYQVQILGTGSDGTWVRTSDGNADGEIQPGMVVMVTEGNQYADTPWKLITNGPIVLGVTELVFAENYSLAFGNVFANGTAVLANTVSAPLTLEAGNNISIVGNNTTKTVSIAVTGISLTSIANGTSNVDIAVADGNVTTTVNGNTTLTVTDTGADVVGYVTATGNVTADTVVANVAGSTAVFSGNITADTVLANIDGATGVFSGNVTADYFLGNLDGDTATFTGNITADTVLANVDGDTATFTGNITADTLLGTVDGATATFTGNVTADTFFGNISGNIDAGGANTEIQFNDNDVLAGSPGFTFDKSSNLVTVAGNVDAGNLVSSGSVDAVGNVTGGNIVTLGSVEGGTATFTGNVTADTVLANVDGDTATFTGNVTADTVVANVAGATATFTGNVTADTFLGNVAGDTAAFTGNVTADTVLANVAGTTATFTGNVTADTVLANVDGTTATFTGNVTADYFQGNVAGDTATFTGNVTADYFLGNIDGTTATFTGNVTADTVLANVDGATATFTGNVTADTFLGNVDGTTATFTGNVTADYFIGNIQGNIDAGGANTEIQFNDGDILAGSPAFTFDKSTNLVSITGNVSSGNVNTGLVVATGNITGANVITPTVTTAVGDLTLNSAGGDLDWAGTGNILLNGRWINNIGAPAAATDAATKQYVDDAVSSGITIHEPVQLLACTFCVGNNYTQGGTTATVTDTVAGNTVVFSSAIDPQVNDQLWFDNSFNGILGNVPYFVVSAPNTSAAVLSTIYDGVPVSNITTGGSLTESVRINSGQGATITNAGANVRLTVDSTPVTTGNRVLLTAQTNPAQNGVYDVTEQGAPDSPGPGAQWVLTRSSDMDTYIPNDVDGLDAGDYFYVQDGVLNKGESWVMTAPTGPVIIGYANLTFTQFSASQVYSANTSAGLVLNGVIFSAKVDEDTTTFDGGGNISIKAGANLVTPNIGAATGTSLDVTGNVTANYFLGNGSQLTGISVSTSQIFNGDSNVDIAAANADITMSVAGTANVVVVSTDGITVQGNVIGNGIPITTVSSSPPSDPEQGDIWIDSDTAIQYIYFNDGSSNQWAEMEAYLSINSGVDFENIASNVLPAANVTYDLGSSANRWNDLWLANSTIYIGDAQISATGSTLELPATVKIGTVTLSETGGNLDLPETISANIITATGNITGGNISTTGEITATGNIQGGNIETGGEITAVGNVTAGNLTPISPLEVAFGGTGADSAANALSNLGAASVGKAIAMTIVFG